MRVLLLGGTGNLGVRLIPSLLSHPSTHLTLYIRNIPKLHSLLSPRLLSHPNLTVTEGDATDPTAIKRALIDNDIEGIVNVAGNQVLPWKEYLLPKIAKAVCDAAVDVGRERGGKPLRAWVATGAGELEYPGTGGWLLADYAPKGSMNQHKATRKIVESIPLTDLRWSLICVSAMYPLDPKQGLFEPLETPRNHNLLLKASSPPAWEGSWAEKIPFIGRYLEFWVCLLSYWTIYEDVADFLAEDMGIGSEEWIGLRVGMKDKRKVKTA